MDDNFDYCVQSFFLGPQAENSAWLKEVVARVFENWFSWRRSRFPDDGEVITEQLRFSPQLLDCQARMEEFLSQLMGRLEAETPTFSPRYIGHMVSEISLPALLGHLVALLHNPNNASEEVAKVGIPIEEEAIAALAAMVGFDEACGHFTSGGTLANFEALWRARYRLDHCLSFGAALKAKGNHDLDLIKAAHQDWQTRYLWAAKDGVSEIDARSYSMVLNNPWQTAKRISSLFNVSYQGPVVLVPGSKHYSWQKGVSLFGLGNDALWPIELDHAGRVSLSHLQSLIESARHANRPILMIVSVGGSTELGEFDPIDKVQDLLDDYRKNYGLHFWHHVDGAYGGFFRTLFGSQRKILSERLLAALSALPRVDSITLDPHKLGYVPYSCGAFLVRDKEHYLVSRFDAPYLSDELSARGKWAWTLEGSRAATGAAATWLTANAIGFHLQGLGVILEKGIEARREFAKYLADQIPELRILPYGETNILCFCLAKESEPLSATNSRTDLVYRSLRLGKTFAVSRTDLVKASYQEMILSFAKSWQAEIDTDKLTLIRMVFMNPFILASNLDYKKTFAYEISRIMDSPTFGKNA